MSNSLRDQLLGLGFKPAPKPERSKQEQPKHDKSKHERSKHDKAKSAHQHPAKKTSPAKSSEEIDLAKAYAIRTQKEKQEREQAEREKQEKARLRKEGKAKLEAFMKTQTVLNVADADQARHFNYGGKIKRVYVTAEQLVALNKAELGVMQMNGRYLLVSAATLVEAKAIFAEAVALEVDPNAPVEEISVDEKDYNDPKYQIPDDLTW